MGMVVKTNMGAINANNALTRNNSSVNKNIEKLSTGMKINRAADDASGLAISEKMKRQIKALDTSTANCEDGISLIQTAEGYMDEVHSMLNRMVELAEKSANGTYELGDTPATAPTYSGGEMISVNTISSDGKTAVQGIGYDRAALQKEMDQLCAEIDRIATTANFNGNKLMDGSKALAGGKGIKLQIGETSNDQDKLTVNVDSFKTHDLFGNNRMRDTTTASALVTNSSAAGLKCGNATAKTLNISDQDMASRVAEDLKNVINEVSLQRADLGAQQNRLEHTINNLTTASENITSANSRIRDTDMAKQMMQYTQGNVLTQAAQAMLAQANQAPQSVLQLLQ